MWESAPGHERISMIGDFLDTNVLVYAYDTTYPDKQRIAKRLLSEALSGSMSISTQVLVEFAATFLHKSSVRLAPDAVISILDLMKPIRVVPSDTETVRRAVEARAAYGVHFYDGMIIAAAERAGCRRIISEDFNPGQRYFGITVENPFQ